MSDINCPYCDAELSINHNDGFGYEENVAHEMQCPECEKSFVFQTSITFSYEPFKADCLNGEPHDYKPTHTFPNVFTVMRCTMCEGERELTDEERINLGIQTKEQFRKEIESLNKKS